MSQWSAMRTSPLQFALKRTVLRLNPSKRKDRPIIDKKNPPSLNEGGILWRVARRQPGLISTNGDLTRLDCFGFGQMDSQQTLFNASADFRRIDAGIEIENAAEFASLSFTMHRSPEFTRQRPVAAEDQFAVLNGDFDALLVHAGHFHFESVTVSILVKVNTRREILHALSRFTRGFRCR